MDIEYITRDSAELESLEDMMKKLPVTLNPTNVQVIVKRAGLQAVRIIQKYAGWIERVSTNPTQKVDFVSYNPCSPELIVGSGDYTYIIDLRREEKKGDKR